MLDLVEEFRVPVVDAAIFPFFINRLINKRNIFEKIGKNEYQLSAEGKSLIVEAVLKRLAATARWHGKRYTVKQIIEQQVQLLARYFMNRESRYQAFDATEILPATLAVHE